MAEDPFEDRRPTSHERMTGLPWDASYDDGPDSGPHPVTREDLRAAFSHTRGWQVTDISPDRVHTRYHGDAGAPAWLATMTRLRD